MGKRFLTSVGNIFFYDTVTGEEILRGTTLIDTSIDFKLNSTDVRGGFGAPLLYAFYNQPDMTIQINEAQFSLEFLAASVGSAISTGDNIFSQEFITLDAAKGGTLTGTPIVLPGASTKYVWILHPDQTVEKVTVTTSAFTSVTGAVGEEVCVRYYNTDAAARVMTINSNIIPKIGMLVIETQLNDSDASTNKIGKIVVTINRATLTGNFNIAQKMDSVASTPLMARALRSENLESAACDNVPVLAKVTEVLDNATWYSSVIGLSIEGGDFGITTGTSPKTLRVWAVPSSGAAFLPPVADLTFSSSDTGKATVGANTGVVTFVAAGPTNIKVVISAKNTIEATAVCTAS